MAIKASGTITLASVVDVDSLTPYYLQQTATLNPPSKPTSNPPSSSWVTSQPAFDYSKSLYITMLIVYSNGAWEYSDVSLVSEYEASKSAYNTAQNAADTANTVNGKVDELNQTVDESIADLTEATGDLTTQIETANESIANQDGDISQLQTSTQANAGNIAANASSIGSLQLGQTTINNNIVSIQAKAQALSDRTSVIESAVVINPAEPSVSVVSGQGAVKITDAKVIIRSNSTSVAWGDAESFNAQKGVFTEIRPRMMNINGQAQQAGLVFLVRNNGHVSLKRAE